MPHKSKQQKQRHVGGKGAALWHCAAVLGFFLLPAVVLASNRLYFEPQELSVGSDGEFRVAVYIDTDEAVNAFDVSVAVPESLVPRDTENGDSIINFWVQMPHFDETTRLLRFAGIIPGGYTGEGGHLLTLVFLPNASAVAARLSFDSSTKVLRNEPNPTPLPLRFDALTLPVVSGKENFSVTPSEFDTDPPEMFTPRVARDPNLFGGKYFVVFSTQDKISGVARYFVSEHSGGVTDSETLPWKEAQSPYVLRDQTLSKYVSVKAVDHAGNERVMTIPPLSPHEGWRYTLLWYGLPGLFLVLLLWWRARDKSSL